VKAVAVAAEAVAAGGGAAGWLEYASRLHALAEREEEASGRPSPRRDDALTAFRRATEADPENAAAWSGGGLALLGGGRAEEALPWLERAIELEPRRLEPWAWKAIALSTLGREPEAAEALSRGRRNAWLGRDVAGPPSSPLQAVASMGRPLVAFVWSEKRGLALTAVLYVLGLVVWSLNAARRDLGLGAAADLQYLLAGLAPALVVAFALALLVAWWKVPAWSRDRLLSWSPRTASALATVGAGLWAVGMLAVAVLGWSGVLDRVPALTAVALGALVIGLAAQGLAREDSWLFRVVWYVYAPVLLVVLAFTAFAFYAEAVYPRLPQSLGGGKPRCAQLDLETASLSAATVTELAPAASRPYLQTLRTAELDIVFSRGETLFVKRPASDRVLELRGGSVRAVVACG
jgi:hypothetical protein